jgi:DNA polymerase I-like protein with 3'-5' exonuclease and polymerase domains
LFKEAYAFLPQSTIADRVNLSFIELTQIGLDTRLQTHDEIVVNCRKEHLIQTVQHVVGSMTAPFQINQHNVGIPVEIAYGESWGRTTILEPGDYAVAPVIGEGRQEIVEVA